MHVAARQFVEKALADFGPITGDVVEFGSRDANGGVRDLFTEAKSYLGIDVKDGNNVDLVKDATTWVPDKAYACVISTETFEHMANWFELIRIGAQALSPDGLMIITCATNQRPRHSATIPNQKPAPGEFYANVPAERLRELASRYNLESDISQQGDDLYATLRQKVPSQTGIEVIGAGMWRTGTVSLKKALEELTGRPCHHMSELNLHPRQVNDWLSVINGTRPDWTSLLKGYGSTLDWPSLAYWEELYNAYPDSLVLLSTRDSDDWWNSISQTVLATAPTKETAKTPWDHLIVDLFDKHFVGRHPTRQQAINFYEKHNKRVRQTVAFNRLIEWTPDDGWLPLCRAFHKDVPNHHFPHLNTTKHYQVNHK